MEEAKVIVDPGDYDPSAVNLNRAIPIIEVFGPTIQGEGPQAGTITHFVRTGGCGYRCKWCDTMYAVDPVQVRRNSTRMTPNEILQEVKTHGPAPWVTLSGGDPCLHKNLGTLVYALQNEGFKVAVETQGQIYQQWIQQLDQVVLSPKPPSSGMVTNLDTLDMIVKDYLNWGRTEQGGICLKIVAFDDEDFEYIKSIARFLSMLPLYISAGSEVGSDKPIVDGILKRLEWLTHKVTKDDFLRTYKPGVVVGCQQHVLMNMP